MSHPDDGIFIVGIDDDGNAGLTGVFATEAVARFAARHILRPRLCRIEWIDDAHAEAEGEPVGYADTLRERHAEYDRAVTVDPSDLGGDR